MDTYSTLSVNSFFSSEYSIDTSMSSDSSSIFSMYSEKNYTNQHNVKSKKNTTSKWFSDKLRSTLKKPLKSSVCQRNPKTQSKQRFCIRLTPATHDADNTYGLDTLFNIDKNLTNKYRSTLFKIMDKPLEWFKIKTKKSNLRRKSTTNFKSLAVNNNIDNTNKSQIINLNFLMSAPSMSSSLNYELSNIDNTSGNNSFMLEEKFHSTPQSHYCNQFSPIVQPLSIMWNDSYLSASSLSLSNYLLVSTPINVTSSLSKVNKSIYSQTPSLSRRLTFGITSSPKNLESLINDDDDLDDSMFNKSNDCPNCTRFNDFNEHELKLIEHLNSVKRNVKLGVKVTYNQSPIKKDLRKNIFKCKKLQKMFQKKLRKQIKQTINW